MKAFIGNIYKKWTQTGILICLLFFSGLLCAACGIEPVPPAMETQPPHCWTARELQTGIFRVITSIFVRSLVQLIFENLFIETSSLCNSLHCSDFFFQVRIEINTNSVFISVMSDSLQPYGLQHARPPCPSPTPGVYSNSCPSGAIHPSQREKYKNQVVFIIFSHLHTSIHPIPPFFFLKKKVYGIFIAIKKRKYLW